MTGTEGRKKSYRMREKGAIKLKPIKKPVPKSNRPLKFKVSFRYPLTTGPFAHLPQVYDNFSSHPVRKTLPVRCL